MLDAASRFCRTLQDENENGTWDEEVTQQTWCVSGCFVWPWRGVIVCVCTVLWFRLPCVCASTCNVTWSCVYTSQPPSLLPLIPF